MASVHYQKKVFKLPTAMDPPHPLKALLQLQLASDSYAVLHLSYVLGTLTSACFLPSPHTQKWTARINSLMQSKDPGARWAGLCIAHQTSVFSKSIMIEFAQSWLGVALPLLSVSLFRVLRGLFISYSQLSLEKRARTHIKGVSAPFDPYI
jgi:hypothetical protein